MSKRQILTIPEIIERAGGGTRIEKHVSVSRAAIYKWVKNGIPDEHWPALIWLAGVSADDLLQANVEARTRVSVDAKVA